MFHRFSATPAKPRRQTKDSGLARISSNDNYDADSNPSSELKVLPMAKRQKTARACDHCRLHRIKCDEQKPCTQCVSIKAKCVVSYTPLRSSQANNSDPNNTSCKSLTSARARSKESSRGRHSISTSSSTANSTANSSPIISPSVSPPRMSQESSMVTRTPPDNVHKECVDLAAPIQRFFASGQPAFSHSHAHGSILGGCLFPQLPHPAVPLGESPLVSKALLKGQRSYYLRLFWDVCHPLLQIMSEAEFAELDALPPPSMFDEYSVRSSLVDAMIALGMQHSHSTGLTGRILGLQQPSSRQYYHPVPSPEPTWPGFDYFHRCREHMRTNTEVTLDGLRCHILMTLYLVKGNAFCDAYNLLGITVRKAYIAKLHRLPPSHLSEAGRTAHMQLWSTLLTMDLQCSLQLDMPAAIQKSLVKCPIPAEDALARYVSSPSHRAEGVSACAYSLRLANLAVIMSDIATCFSTADLDNEGGNNAAALEHHALNLSSALQKLEVWRDQLPSELLLSRGGNSSGNAEMLDFDRDLALPPWLQRQAVLIELHYHNAYTLIQRPFFRLRYAHTNGTTDSQPHAELHIASAFNHAIIIVDTVFTVCSMSDVLYGWSEVLQPLWNATMTIMAYVYSNSLSSAVPRALDSLTRAQAVFESFSSTSPTAHSAKDIVQSLASNLQSMVAQGSSAFANDDPMSWDLFASLLVEKQTPSTGTESAPSSIDLNSNIVFSPFMASAPPMDPNDFNLVPMQFGPS